MEIFFYGISKGRGNVKYAMISLNVLKMFEESYNGRNRKDFKEDEKCE